MCEWRSSWRKRGKSVIGGSRWEREREGGRKREAGRNGRPAEEREEAIERERKGRKIEREGERDRERGLGGGGGGRGSRWLESYAGAVLL